MEVVRPSKRWLDYVRQALGATLKERGFRKLGPSQWRAKHADGFLWIQLQRSTVASAGYLRWFCNMSATVPEIKPDDDFEPVRFRKFAASWGTRLFDPAGPIRWNHWRQMREFNPNLVEPTGPENREYWDIMGEDEVEPRTARFLDELVTVGLPELQHFATFEGMLQYKEGLLARDTQPHAHLIEIVRVGRRLRAERALDREVGRRWRDAVGAQLRRWIWLRHHNEVRASVSLLSCADSFARFVCQEACSRPPITKGHARKL